MSTVETFDSYVKKLWDSGAEEFGPCGYCEDTISRRDVGENEVAINLTVELYSDGSPVALPIIYHRDCCPCQTDQKLINQDWEELDVRFHDKIDKRGALYDYKFVGILLRCPFCGRIYDDDGQEVAL